MTTTTVRAPERTADGAFEWGYFVPAARLAERVRTQTLLLWLLVAAVAAVAAAALVFQSGGGRWFVVETPSMGTAAPVGTLVLTRPATVAELRVGDVITYRTPDGTGELFTHRVVEKHDGTVTTQGDINGALDPWQLTDAAIAGRAIALLPGAGWAVRALPLVSLGMLLLWVLTAPMSSRAWRGAARVLGVSVVASVVVYVLKPLVGIVMLTTDAAKHGAQATVVSTGLLPISVKGDSGRAVHLASGQVATVRIPSAAADGQYHLMSNLDLSALGWVAAIALCALPLAYCLIVGLPRDAREELA